MKNRKILFVAYFYPPAGGLALPAAQRVVKFVRHLPIKKKYVLTLKMKLYADYISNDNSLSLPVNNESIIRTGSFDLFKMLLEIRSALKKVFPRKVEGSGMAIKKNTFVTQDSEDINAFQAKNFFSQLKDLISDLFTFPDYAHGWIIPSLIQGRRLIKRENIDVIFATGMPWTSLLVGCGLKMLTGAKLIIDFRDPWVNNPFATNKGVILKRVEIFFEKMVVKIADCITLNTPELTSQFKSKYGYLAGKKFHTIYNGYDPIDFQEAKTQITDSYVKCEKLVVSHVGFLYGLRDPMPMFDALKYIREKNPLLAKKIVFQQIGHINLNYNINFHVKGMGFEENFMDLGPLSYNAALQNMASSDILMIIQPRTTTQIPSKIYEYIFLDKPIISIGSESGALARLIKEYSFGEIFSETDVLGLSDYLIEKAEQKAGNNEFLNNYSNRGLFDIRNISKKLYEIIERI